jgi:hypothetical protein
MNSLSELNAYSATQIAVTDTRPSTVIFDTDIIADQNINIDSLNETITAAANILEVINFETANVRYQISIKSQTNPSFYTTSSLNFGILPAGLTLTVNAGVYTITGITNKSLWDQVRYPTWTLPSNYNSIVNFYLEVKVIWYDSLLGQDRNRSWFVSDPRYFFIANLSTTANLTSTVIRAKGFNVPLSSKFDVDVEQGNKQLGRANLFSKFQVSTAGMAIGITSYSANLSSSFSTLAFAIRIRGMANLSGTSFSLLCNPVSRKSARGNLIATATNTTTITQTFGITNMTNRTYLSNVPNAIFATSTPVIGDPVAGAVYTITLSSPNGEFGTITSSTSNYSFTGTISQINAQWTNIRFFPNKDYSSNSTFTYTQTKAGITTVNRTLSLNYAGAGTVPTLTYTFFNSSTWTPTYVEKKYSVFDYLLVGGGGAGGSRTAGQSNGSGGGGGGGVRYSTDQPLLANSYSFTVALGGQPVAAGNGGAGGSTTGFGFTVGGGLGGGRCVAGGTNGIPGGGGENSTGASGGFGTGTMYNLRPLGGGGGSGSTSRGFYRTNDVFNQAPGAGGDGESHPIYGAVVAQGGGGGVGLRAEIGANGTGARGFTLNNPGCGGGGGGGSALEELGDPGQPGIVVIRTHG